MKLGDGKWVKKQPKKRTIRTRKAGVTKGQAVMSNTHHLFGS